MRTSFAILALLLALTGAAAPAHAQFAGADSGRVLNLSFDQQGRVTLSARNVTVRDILLEWARQCGCYVVNGDKLSGAPLAIPLLYEHESQAKVLESLLRQVAGYVLTPQRAGVVSKSNFETIYILATSSPVSTSYAPPPTTSNPMPTTGAPDDEIPPILPPGAPRPMTNPPPPTALPPGAEPPGAPPQGNVPSSRPAGTLSTFVPISPVDSSRSSMLPGSTPPGTTPQGSVPPPMPVGAPGR